tara:strand:+ start:323 stop:733 length:411 start_codon:yes stop_codon:yes gene_type:complete
MIYNDTKTLYDFIPNYPKGSTEPFIAKAGKKNKFDSITINKKEIISMLSNVFDPEIPINIYDLGLIYDVKISNGNNVSIKMSLTSPGCPVAGELPKQVADELTKINKIGLIEVELVWDPPWTKDRMSEDAKLALDI